MDQKKLARTRKGLLVAALLLALVLLAFDRYAAYAHKPAPDSTQVVIYTTTWCPYCRVLRQALTANQIPYTEYDVERSLQGQLGMWALRGRGVPVSAIGPEVIYGYRVDKIDAALKALGYTFANPAAPTSAAGDGASSRR